MGRQHHEVEKAARRVTWICVSCVLAFAIWASVSSVEQIVRASGILVPTKSAQIIQNLEGGIVAHLPVGEGDVVKRGQLLVMLEDTQVRVALQEGRDRLSGLIVRQARVRAELDELDDFEVDPALLATVPEIVVSERALFVARKRDFQMRIKENLAIVEQAEREMVIMEELSADGIVAPLDVEKARRRYHEAELSYRQVDTSYRRELAVDQSRIAEEIKSLRHKISIRQDQLSRMRLHAAEDGIVNRVFVEGQGAVVGPAERILEVVPITDQYLLELRVANRDIANVQVGQVASVKFDAWDYSVYGMFTARVAVVSANTFEDQTPNGTQAYYKVVLTLEDQNNSELTSVNLRPGMQAVAELHTGKKSVLGSLLRPLLVAKDALRES